MTQQHPDRTRAGLRSGRPQDVDIEALEAALKVLASASRLELLWQLGNARTVDEIQLTPSAARAGDRPDRTITRQAVGHHLRQLEQAGLLTSSRASAPGGRQLREWRTDHSALFAIIDGLRRLNAAAPDLTDEPGRTAQLGSGPAAIWEEGPKLVQAQGVQEGRCFPLRHRDLGDERGWIIGRRPGVAIHVPHDPYVSAENAELLHQDGEFRLLDLRGAKNGTFVNWHRLPVGGSTVVETGDVIGVGRTLLVFRAR